MSYPPETIAFAPSPSSVVDATRKLPSRTPNGIWIDATGNGAAFTISLPLAGPDASGDHAGEPGQPDQAVEPSQPDQAVEPSQPVPRT